MLPAIPIAPGQRFNRWTVLSEAPKRGTHRMYLCRCDCGTEKAHSAYTISVGNSKSCGCLRREISSLGRHGHARTTGKSKAYLVWEQMCGRCNCPTNKSFANYGGRGITVCERWLKFDHFLADMGEPPTGLMIERSDVNGNYEPSNCSWASRIDQNNNTRANVLVFASEGRFTLAQFARRYGLHYDAMRWALSKGVRQFAGQSITIQYPEDRA